MTKRDFIFEIGTEEIPAQPLYAATDELQKHGVDMLDNLRIPHGKVLTCSTPRRIILQVKDMADESEQIASKKRGPSAAIAFDESGAPTKAGIGFARAQGIGTDELVREKEADGKEYVYAIVSQPAKSSIELLREALPGLVAGISWPKTQRWGSGHVTFSRPIRWFVALFGDTVVAMEYAGLVAGRLSRGHRLIAPDEVEIASAEEFFDAFTDMWVVPSAAERAAIIRDGVACVEAQSGLCADMPKNIFDEVVNLVEYPSIIVGHFDERFLDVPPEIICDAMLEHQRYFPMYRADGSLDNAFIITGNGNPIYADTIREGNERVVRARLDDAAFFVEQDCRKPLADYVDELDKVVFQEKLGSVRDKTLRIVKIAGAICDNAGIEESEREDAERAAYLCKADLITSAVVEFTSLQGVMGGHYARFSNESEGVARAITDHYRPRFAGDKLPRDTPGKVVALADKLDTVCGIFAAGEGPSGSSDPYAVRRSAIGIIQILLSGLCANLRFLIDFALSCYEDVIDFNVEKIAAQLRSFFTTRLSVIACDRGYAPDVVAAVTAVGMFEPAETIARIDALQDARENAPETFDDLSTAYTRADHLRDASLGTDVDETPMGAAEKALLLAVGKAQEAVDSALSAGDHTAAVAALAALRAPIDTFFEQVMVMSDDLYQRKNRLRLLNLFTSVFENVADIGLLAKK